MNRANIARVPWNASLAGFHWTRDHLEFGARAFVQSAVVSILAFCPTFFLYAHTGDAEWVVGYILFQAYLSVIACINIGRMYAVTGGPVHVMEVLGLIVTGKLDQIGAEVVNVAAKVAKFARWVILVEWLIIVTCLIFALTGVKDKGPLVFGTLGSSVLVAMSLVVPWRGRLRNLGSRNKWITAGVFAAALLMSATDTPSGYLLGIPYSQVLPAALIVALLMLVLWQTTGIITAISIGIWMMCVTPLVLGAVLPNEMRTIENSVASARMPIVRTMHTTMRTVGYGEDFMPILKSGDTLAFEAKTPLRLVTGTPISDKVQNVYYKVFSAPPEFRGPNDTVGKVPPNSKTCLVMATDLSEHPSGSNPANGHRFSAGELWDRRESEPVRIASFNLALDAAVEVRPNTSIMHPLGDSRITPSVYYGIIQQWDGKRNWGDVFPTPVGAPVYASASGVVVAVYHPTHHTVSCITVRHNTKQGAFYTRYQEVGKILVATGDNVVRGDTIAYTDGRPEKPGSRSEAREAHLRFEVWAMVKQYHAYFPVDTMRWIEWQIAPRKIEVPPQEFTAYPIYPVDGTGNEYEVPVNRPVSIIAQRVRAYDRVRIEVVDPGSASYVINGRQRNSAYHREEVSVVGKPYTSIRGSGAKVWEVYHFYTDRMQAANGQLIAGMDGFARPYGLSYGVQEFYAMEDGWICLAINEPVGVIQTGEQMEDQSADNYVKHGTRDVVRIKVTIGLNGST